MIHHQTDTERRLAIEKQAAQVAKFAARSAAMHISSAQEELLANERRLAGENHVLRGLLTESLGVIETITDSAASEDWALLIALKTKITSALQPAKPTGSLL